MFCIYHNLQGCIGYIFANLLQNVFISAASYGRSKSYMYTVHL